MKIGIVILNYKNYKDTIECVDSILNQISNSYYIVIVDNGSPNDSYDKFIERYRLKENVKILRTVSNIGFAKGNNCGIKYARNTLFCEAIFVLNNDTILNNNVLCEIEQADLCSVAVASPSVIDSDGRTQGFSVNSNNLVVFTGWSVFSLCFTTMMYLPGIAKLYHFYQNKKKKYVRKKENHDSDCHKYVVQGSAFILTPVFFQKYTQLYPNTFLYWEEMNLMWYLKKAKLQSGVIKTTPIIHKVSRSTLVDDRRAKFSFKYSMRRWKSLLCSIPVFILSYNEIARRYS